MESDSSQTPETPQQNSPNDGVVNQQPYQQQPPYQQQAEQPHQSYGGQPGGYTYTNPSGSPSNGGMVPPKNYMTESIVVTVISFLCCCSPISVVLGIIAIVKANNVNTEFERGNINEALSNADSAKKLALWAAIVAVAFYILGIIWSMFMISQIGGWDSFMDEVYRNM